MKQPGKVSVVSGNSDQSKSYRLIRPLAEMFHSQIHLAEWSGVEGFVKQVTVWKVRPELCTSQQTVDVLLDGLSRAARLSASTGAQVLDVWWADGQIVYAAEHVSGMAMSQALAYATESQRLLPLDTLITALLDVVHALEQAHDPEARAGAVIHGDLQPECVLFGYEGTVKLTAYGFGSFLPIVSSDGSWCTWSGRCYQPPERLHSVTPTPETDVYSVGAMLLEGVTGVPPYGTDNPEDIMLRLRAGDTAFSHRHNTVPDDLAAVIHRACMPQPADRYPSMTELAADLHRIQIERRRAGEGPPIRLRDLLQTLETPAQRREKVESSATRHLPSHKSQILKSPRMSQVITLPPVTPPTAPLVGRNDLLKTISQALAATNTGRGQAIMVTGEAGMGRTRLLTEVALRLSTARRKLAWVAVKCDDLERHQRYGAVLRLLCSAVGLPPEAPLERLADEADKLRAFGLEGSMISAVRGVLGQEKPPEPARLAGLMSQAVLQCLSSLSWEQTTLVAWDDCHWTDEASMACLTELTEQLSLMPVVLLLTAPTTTDVQLPPTTYQVLELRPLSSRECQGLVLHRMDSASVVESSLMDALIDRTGGNPSLLRELVDLLVESYSLEVREDMVCLTPQGASGGIPGLREGVFARFATLSAEVATVAVAAALAGPALNTDVIAQATGLTVSMVKQALAELVQRHVLQEQREGLTFPHERLREATLDAAGPDHLAAMRGEVARAVLARAGESSDGWRDHSARLLADAGDQPGAAQVLVEAAQHLEGRGDLAGAAENYSRALGLTSDTAVFGADETLRLCLKAGNAALHSLRLDLGEQALNRAVGLAAHLDNASAGSEARVLLCRLLARQGRLGEAMEAVQEAIPLAEQAGDPLILAQAYTAIAESYQQWGEYGPDFEYLEPALKLASESGDLLQMGRSLQLAVTHAAGVGKYERTEQLLKRGRAIAKKADDPLLTCQLIRAESLLYTFSGDPERGLDRTLDGLELAHSHGLEEMEVIFLHNAGDAHLRCGRMQEAFYYFNESLRRSIIARFDRLTEGNDMYLGFLEDTYLQAPGGWQRLQDATEKARETGRIWNVTQGHLLMGKALISRGEIDEALHHFEEAQRLAEATGVAFFVQEANHWLDEARKQQYQ